MPPLTRRALMAATPGLLGGNDRVPLRLLTDRSELVTVLDVVVQGNTRQPSDKDCWPGERRPVQAVLV